MTETSIELLERLVARCKGSVSVSFNEHLSCYDTIEKHLDHRQHRVEDGIVAEMLQKDRLVEVQAYPYTPISFIFVAHHDLTAALVEVHRQLDQEPQT